MRISELERELDEITKKAIMTSTHASKTAKALSQVSLFVHLFSIRFHLNLTYLFNFLGRNGRGCLCRRIILQKEQEGHDREQPEDGKGLKGHEGRIGLPN